METELMDEFERVETEELDAGQTVRLEYLRQWPKYVVRWSVRKRSGDSDFPVTAGEVSAMPPKGEESIEDLWQRLRDDAVEEARSAAPPQVSGDATAKPSLLSRLFGRSGSSG